MVNFNSQLGISLGLSRKQVGKIIGLNYNIKKDKAGAEVITYYTNNQKDDIFKKYNGVGYSIICKFLNNKLVDYAFGFEYP